MKQKCQECTNDATTIITNTPSGIDMPLCSTHTPEEYQNRGNLNLEGLHFGGEKACEDISIKASEGSSRLEKYPEKTYSKKEVRELVVDAWSDSTVKLDEFLKEHNLD